MTETAKKKAYRALLNAETKGENKHFPRVWVVGEHVFFTYRAAQSQKEYDEVILGIEGEEIEEVTYKEAANHDVLPHEDWRDEVDWNVECMEYHVNNGNYGFRAFYIQNNNAMKRPVNK